MMGAHHFPEAVDLPIPQDVKPGRGWCRFMVEMADHIGAYDVLRLCEVYGGQEFYVPIDPAKNPFLPLIGAKKAKAISWAYQREVIAIPTASYAIARARRGGVIASVRAGSLAVGEAARILRLRRDYVSRLVNRTQEGDDAPPCFRPARKVDPRQIDMFPEA